MLPYFPQPSNSNLLEDELVDIVPQLIPAGWKYTMTCVNFKPLKHSMEKLVEYLNGVKHLETKNHPERNNWNNNNSSSLKKTKRASINVTRTKSPKTFWTATRAPRKATNIASSARCLVAMLNCMPLIIATRRICCQ
eukprot:7476405-Ditylum_brightwellii.AAC.1